MSARKNLSYPIYIEAKALNRLGEMLADSYAEKEVYVVSDRVVYGLYQEALLNALAGYSVETVVIEPGEGSKSLSTYESVAKRLIEQGIRRDHLIIAFGGGVVGDLAGFVAATLYRGIRWVQVPTTLLAQVDSSIGAKVGINLPLGKNLIGAFHQPELVLIDPELLDTLEYREYNNGIAEMIKAALIGDPRLYARLKDERRVGIEEIDLALAVKKRIVLEDPYEEGLRMVLNFGHTFGHAIERAHGYRTYKHGEAISYGMLMALEVGIERGITPRALYDEVKELLLAHGLIELPLLERKDYVEMVAYDKKRRADGLRFILLKDIGNAVIERIDL
ncbi:MAG: 3-dehydroquinate synthase [Acholeplasmataceae bacterium]